MRYFSSYKIFNVKILPLASINSEIGTFYFHDFSLTYILLEKHRKNDIFPRQMLFFDIFIAFVNRCGSPTVVLLEQMMDVKAQNSFTSKVVI